MLDYPRLRSDLAVASVGGDKLFLRSHARDTLIQDPTAVALASLLDGKRTVSEIISALNGTPLPSVLGTLTALERMGYLADGPAEGNGTSAYWDAVGRDPRLAAQRAATQPVAVRGVGDADPGRVRDALHRAGLNVAAEGELLVVVADDYLAEELAEINRAQLAAGASWLLVKTSGTELWLGPHLRFGGACWACLADRLATNRQLERYLDGHDAQRLGSVATPALPSTHDAAGSLLATELQTILAGGGPSRLDECVMTLDLLDFSTASHAVIRQPQCPECGDPETARRPVQIELEARPKRYTDDGGHRVSSPSETLDRLAKHISPITGVVTSLRSQNTDDNGVAYSYCSGHNFALMQDSTFFLRKNMRGRSGGKGRTDTQARTGAVCEAIERYCGVYRGRQDLRAAYESLADGRAIHPATLLDFSEAQYAGREAWNGALNGSYHVVPERFDEQRPVEWTPVWSLTHARERLVPAAYCWFGHPDLYDHFFCASDANGNAAGNTLEEAVLQGLLELVERDAVAIWWYNRLRRPAFDLDSINEPYVDMVREHYRRIDRELWMLDLTVDLGIPVFCAVSQRRGGPTEDLLIGFGAHIDVHTAAMRALTELNQFLPAVTDINPDGTTNYWMDDPDAIAWWTTQTLAANDWLRPADGPAAVPDDFDFPVSDDLACDVRACVDRLERAGHEVMVLDQTRPDIELFVVKVICPGLRHFWRRLGPGRLYDVPVALGWLDVPNREDQLNPSSVFF